jgi:phosphatidylserine decarboxylase
MPTDLHLSPVTMNSAPGQVRHAPIRWRRIGLPIASPGWRETIFLGGGLAALAVVLAWFSLWVSVLPGMLGLFVVWFFRDPSRRVPTTPGAVVSPADGVITDVEELADSGVGLDPAIKIGIYLSVFNVHVNRVPIAARVLEVRYCPGLLLNTRRPDAAWVNEQCWTLLEGTEPPHPRLLVKQVAGTFARRIVCAVRPGEVYARGERFGMIKFGSRTELYLSKAPGLRILARPGDKVRGGSSILARYEFQSVNGPSAGPSLQPQ